jgi:hypothetical protein
MLGKAWLTSMAAISGTCAGKGSIAFAFRMGIRPPAKKKSS